MIYKTLKTDVIFCGPNLVFEAKDVSNRSLCTAGAMAIICTGIDSDITKTTGLCCINEMLCYLHVQAKPLMSNFSQLMLMHGKYYFLYQQEASCF